MNYLAHGYRFLDDPPLLAGTALPDWYRAAGLPGKLRADRMQPLLQEPTPAPRLSQGVLLHVQDDRWFHRSGLFVSLSLELAQALRRVLPDDRTLRISFVAHVLVEMFLDAALMDRDPGLLDRYYGALAEVEPAWLERTLQHVLPPASAAALASYAQRFVLLQFLRAYRSDPGILDRLNGLLRRIGLPELPRCAMPLLGQWRGRVAGVADQLLPVHHRDTCQRRKKE